jgi:hypothetical protein
VVLAQATVASAGTFTTPSGSSGRPFVVPADAQGNPIPFRITGSGWGQRHQVWIEQCDGLSPTAPNWSVTADCDITSSPAAAVSNAGGEVSFPAGDHNYAFPVFKGPSPQNLFNCLSPQQKDPHNGLPDFRNCKVRMSTNNSSVTSDQTFLPITLPEGPLPGPTRDPSKSGGSGATPWLIGVGAVIGAALLGGFFVSRRHRLASSGSPSNRPRR